MSSADIRTSSRRASLTPSQVDIWLEQSIHPESTQFIIAVYYIIPLALDTSRFIAAANCVFSQHEALYARLTAGHNGIPEVLFERANAPQCRFLDLAGEVDPQGALQQVIHQQASTPFELLDTCLSNPVLIKTRDDSYCFFCTYHHTLVDGWGIGIIFPRITKAYEDLAIGCTPSFDGGRFADYLDQCRNLHNDCALDRAKEFWKPLMASRLPAISPSHACAPGESELATSCVALTLPRELVDRVSCQAAASHATFFHALLLAYVHLTSRQYSLESSVVAMPILNRSKEHRETIGHFVEFKTIPLPVDVNAAVGENLSAIARHMRDVYRHYHLPGAEITQLYQQQGNPGAPVACCSVSYITRNFDAVIDGVSISMTNVPSVHARTPLALYVFDIYPGRDIRIELVYQRRYLNGDEAELFLGRLAHTLQSFARDSGVSLDAIDVAPLEEKRRIASVLRRDVDCATFSRPIIEDILERACRCPDAIVVENGEASYTYRECLARANAVAQALLDRSGVRPGDRVALLLPRGIDLVAAYLAVMMSGATFVPLDPYSPEMRLRQICDDSAVRCIVTNADLVSRASAVFRKTLVVDALERSETPFAPVTCPDQVAYVIYTSGSTGKPKGVEISHRALAEHLASWLRAVPLREVCEKHLFFHSPAFDASIECVFPALLLGNTLVVAPHPQWAVHQIAKVVVERHVTLLYLPPAYLLEFLKYMQDRSAELVGHVVRLCLVGGETMHAEIVPLWEKAFGRSARLVNLYGPTEVTVTATAFEVPFGYRAEPGQSIPIGKAHVGRALRIVDERGKDVPMGAAGELLIGGIGLAEGYHGMPAETTVRFIMLEDGIRYYRSGDIVRLKSDGNLVFCRRFDRQVKIRGFRVEPGEIEACLLTCRDVSECAVAVCQRTGGDGEWELRAYVALLGHSGANRNSLREYLSSRLPEYMVPSIFVLDALPKNVSGKIDYNALPSMQAAQELPQRDAVECFPKGAIQEYLAVLWAQVLGKSVVDTSADFFELGGHSLLATRLIAKITKAFRIDYPVSAFFDHPTIAATGRILEGLVGNAAKLESMARVRLELSRLSQDEIRGRLEVARQNNA